MQLRRTITAGQQVAGIIYRRKQVKLHTTPPMLSTLHQFNFSLHNLDCGFHADSDTHSTRIRTV
uniref:hypothetical protein n=1 Tax=Pseudomonas aeruginosa TaxID=287 RepID=UPI001C4A4537